MRFDLIVPTLFVCVLPCVLHAEPIRQHADNPRYFQWDGGPAVLITSGEHYGALLNGEFDYERYFDELAAHRLNHTRIFSGAYREVPGDFGITENTLAPRPGHFVCPWQRSDVPGESDGGNKFDLTQWNPDYFKRLHALMDAAKKRGIVVEFTLFCPMYRDSMWKACPMNARNNVNGIGDCKREEVYTLMHEDLSEVHIAFTAKAVRELSSYDNLYFEICNEPYFGGVTEAWQRRIIDAIVEAQSDLPASERHLISVNVANGRKKVENPHPAVSIFNFHYCVPPDVVAMNAGLPKILGENETGFRGSEDVLYRTEAWDFLLAGGALFNNLDYSFTVSHPDGTLNDYESPGGGSRDLRTQLRVLREAIDEFDFTRMSPKPEVLNGVEPASVSRYVLVDPGRAYLAGFHVPIPEKPKNLDGLFDTGRQVSFSIDLPENRYTAEWINTKTGLVDAAKTWDHEGGKARLESPTITDDIGLRLVATPEPPDHINFSFNFAKEIPEPLDDAWRWIREDSGSWRHRAGGLELRAQKGRIWAGNDAKNILVHDPAFEPDGSRAEVSVRLGLPETIYEQGGLLRYAGDDDFVKLIVEHIEGRYYVVMAQETGENRKVHAKVEIPAPTARLAMEVDGSSVRCQFWTARANSWFDAGHCVMEGAGKADYALFTQDGSDEETRWIRFDDFRLVGTKVRTDL